MTSPEALGFTDFVRTPQPSTLPGIVYPEASGEAQTSEFSETMAEVGGFVKKSWWWLLILLIGMEIARRNKVQ